MTPPTSAFSVPEHVVPVRKAVHRFLTERVEPVEHALDFRSDDSRELLSELQSQAKREGLWALGHPAEIGGGGMPFLDYVYVNEIQGRSDFGQYALGTWTLQDSLMLSRHATGECRDRFLGPLVQGKVWPSFAMTEPDVASSDPTRLTTSARLDGGEWVLNGRKWFITGAGDAAFTTVLCRTEPDDAPPHRAFSLIVVPTDTPGYRIVRETPVLGIASGHYELAFDDVRVPAGYLLGERGAGFAIAQERLGPGRIFHCMRWLGQAQRAFELMCERLNTRTLRGAPLGERQLMQRHVFESWAQIQSCRLLTLDAASRIDRGGDARVEIGAIKVVGARMLHDVIDRAVQVHGAAGLTDDTPLSRMYRAARAGRIYDGPDEVHVVNVARRLLREFQRGDGWDFGS
ncbi:acyl-CoA dehydrogenase family protein [Actinomadura chibensis]|uniref:Acyl-CoA dehydrogenase n=1 Tax=Actinomadura chibensis TaxID=392828 RepID=A0A5D0NLR7_9ACTN|nr:acyl-CoA dehydrogenase family protein [Actinomadura chibensis]TYB45460.1 acyl-CoA dehydrogenase [Actinomadura chibensis]